ncbi:hypothetical protein FAM09_10610 [Niastella caeni]|uniref:SlyB protein n=1 Tax=Niastella caeni TaxID=2569763 RepID=A0A4S8HXE1_9BACT|nr:hypothetical protein [Niastella caeni]THU40310.1 hypothetical protein FAM09_10610 [Niastella caeni]
MQKVWLLIPIGLLCFYMSISAQNVNTDSLSLVTKISEDQLKLEKLQSQLERKTKNKQEAAAEAQRSANKNSKAADKLSANPDSKKLARKANKKASEARRDARDARKESDRLDKLHKDIQGLKNKIAENQVKLNKYVQQGRAGRP